MPLPLFLLLNELVNPVNLISDVLPSTHSLKVLLFVNVNNCAENYYNIFRLIIYLAVKLVQNFYSTHSSNTLLAAFFN